MAVMKGVRRLWHPTGSGLVIPGGIESRIQHASTQTFLDIKTKAVVVEEMFAAEGIRLPPTSDLGQMIADVRALADHWLGGQEADIHEWKLMFRALMFDPIADALLMLRGTSDRTRFLSEIGSGKLDSLERTPSHAKNILWEVELWAILKRRGLSAQLQEPPDIVVESNNKRIGIACKKLYSEKHVQNVISEAVAQIEPTFDFGVVALNIDALTPADSILAAIDHSDLSQRLGNLNSRFIGRHERHFRKYLESRRVISVLVSTRCLVDVRTADVRFSNARQSTVWAMPGLPVEKDQALRALYDGLMT